MKQRLAALAVMLLTVLGAVALPQAASASSVSGSRPARIHGSHPTRSAGTPTVGQFEAQVRSAISRQSLSVTEVRGTFRTPPEPASICPPNPAEPDQDCQIDWLFGDIGGPDAGAAGATDKLVTRWYDASAAT